jgi:hypothetical protein
MIRLRRPSSVPVQLRVVGGFGRMDLDGQKIAASGGTTTVETPGARDAADRFDLEIVGGLGKVTIDQISSR